MTALATGVALGSIPKAGARESRKSDPARDPQATPDATQAQSIPFQRETFQPHVGRSFRLGDGDHTVAATLVSLRDCTPSRKNRVTRRTRPCDSFALVFKADGALTDVTTIYDVENGALGKFALFLTHRSGPRGTHFYEAVFNHAL